MLAKLQDCARQRGNWELLLHAQTGAAGCYAREGFATGGEPFEEAGIAHLEMVRAL